MKRLTTALLTWTLLAVTSLASAAMRPCTANTDCFGPGESCVASFCQATSCGNDAQCGDGQRCAATHCVQACSVDSDCPENQGCFAESLCLPFINLTLPDSYGIHASGQPTCSSNSDCRANVDCVPRMEGDESHCRIVRSAPGDPVEFATCGNVNFTSSLFCPSVSGYVCGPQEGDSPATTKAFCESAATCTDQAACVSNYPLATGDDLSCIAGRCTSACSSTLPCADPAQPVCFESPIVLGGVIAGSTGICVASTLQARLLTYHLGKLNPDPAQNILSGQRNLVFLSDGFLPEELASFSSYAAGEIARVTDNVDVVSPLFASLYNLFVLEVPDRASGLGQPTRFGHFKGASSTTQDMPGAGIQTILFANSALEQHSSMFGPAATGTLTRSVLFFNADTFTRAYGGGSLIVQPITEGRPHTLTHEFGHMLGALADEYVQENDVRNRKNVRAFDDEGIGVTEACAYNVISRRLLTGCVSCDGSDDMTLPISDANLALVPWFPFLNESNALEGQFSTTSNAPMSTNGLFIGAGASFDREWIRANAASFMRSQEEAKFFGRASVEGWAREHVPEGSAATIRWMPVLAPEPAPLSNGPLQAVAVSSARHRALYTMRPDDEDDKLAVVSGLTLALEETITLPSAPDADTPRVLVVDDPRDRLVMRSRSRSMPEESKLLFVDLAALTVSELPVPDLFGFPGVDPNSGAIFIQTRDAAGQAALVQIENNSISALDAPAEQPFFSAVPLVSTSESSLLLSAGVGALDNAFCDASHCEIWAIDTANDTLLPGRLSVDMTGEAVPPAIQQATIGQRVDGSELLIVASSSHIRAWEMADLVAALRAGSSLEPSFDLFHTLGEGDVPLAGLAYVEGAADRIVLGNRAGQLSIFDPVAGLSEAIAFEQLRPGMQILGVEPGAVGTGASGYAVVTVGAFDGARNGFLAVIDVVTPTAMLPPGRGRILFEQPLAAAGLSAPGARWDDEWGLIYTTGVVDVGQPGQGNRFRTPVLRGPAALNYQGCL